MNKRILRIPLALLLLLAGLLLRSHEVPSITLIILAYLIAGADVLYTAVRGVLAGQVFDENFLMSLATVGAIIIGEHAEAVAVMVFFQTGELFEHYALDKSRRAIVSAMDLLPERANLLKDDGQTQEVAPEDIKVGDRILVRPGERLPLDGVVLSGVSQLDTAALTGEALPREARTGDEVLSGCVNITGVLTIKVTKPFEQSTVSRILEMVETATDKKSRQESFITRFSAIYTPAVVILALLLAFVPPLFIPGAQLADWVYRALNFLVVSCPCALVISIPLAFFGGIGGASRAGILTKGSNYLEALAKADTFVFDKTGTLTRGRFTVSQVTAKGIPETELLRLAAHAETHSLHPIADAIKKAYGQPLNPAAVGEVQEMPGGGVYALVDGQTVLLGNARLMAQHGIKLEDAKDMLTTSHVALNGSYLGYIQVADTTKPCAQEALSRLRAQGIRKLVMLTGDNEQTGTKVARELGIDVVHAGLLPQDKVQKVEDMLEAPGRKGSLVFAGDGVNDAPVLARADVGFAMGAMGSDAAIEAADIVIMNDDPCKMASALAIAKKTVRIAKQNAVFAIGVKAGVLILSTLGLSTLWMAVFADVGVAVLAILNAMRALRVPPYCQTCAAPRV
ncbi:MAG: cadmium-translocating P-type ATPase [Clostridiales bacterium]|nr:cadmium-translocating P-type ATPase [Clostridiales bacterium]